ncbi:MAG: FdhF/YdeP family oxidoreductase [Polyangiaceae bacterium]|nr:FdhF/YdeP family oxidoreductase [Polyangiaceae bacterium]
MSNALVPLRKKGVQRVSLSPFGLGFQKPRHFLEMLRIAWENRDNLGHAYRVLSQGVCDGCALGTTGMRDWTIDGTHLCLVRLNLLRLNTMGPARAEVFADVDALRRQNGQALRDLGRIPFPLRRKKGERGFARIEWDDVLRELGGRFGQADPDRVAMFMTSRGITNEVYYAAQKAMRVYGSPHIDNAARLCHSPSTAAMKRTMGVAASTCSYKDWYGADIVVFFGSNPANDQPVAMKYLHEAKKRGTRVYSINTFVEPGLDRYWIPSTPESALWGSQICDGFFSVDTGGDMAFFHAVQRRLIEKGAIDRAFIDAHTEGFDEYQDKLLAQDFEALVRASGAKAEDVERFADIVANAKTGVFVWSMGLTQHVHGSDTVAALMCLALSRGFVGRDKCGVMPIRGHSGVQGGAEMGAYANAYPGGVAINDENADRFERNWGVRPPVRIGMSTTEMLEAAYAGKLDIFYIMGGNLRDTLPDPARVEESLARVPVRVHQDIVLTHPMLVDPAEVVYILPARTRYEHRGGVTETTTERRVVFSPHVPGHEIPEAREEWWIPLEIMRAAKSEHDKILHVEVAAQLRREIACDVPAYQGIEKLEKQGDQFQWGGPRLCEGGHFPLPGGRARFELRDVPERSLKPGEFWLATRRGKQFNSIVQAEMDPLTGASRDHVLLHPEDMEALGLRPDQPLVVKSHHGTFEGRAFPAAITRRNVQMFWPEANVLLPSGIVDPGGLVPDYNTKVRIEARA